MRIGANRRVAQAAVTIVIATAVSAAGVSTASAAERSDCTNVSKTSASALKTCIATLTKAADTVGRTAQVADEQYLKAKTGAARARVEYTATKARADAAAALALQARTQAGVAAAQLARSGGTTSQTTQVLLSGDGATQVLYNLSRMSEYTVDTSSLADAAAADSRTAATLQAQSALAADRAQARAATARAAYAKAKKDSAAARSLVIEAEARQRQLTGSANTSTSVSASVALPANASTAQKVLAFARSQIGDPYVFGAAGPGSWDCSGLTMGAFASVGVDIGGHGATVQYTTARSRGLLVPYSSAQPGDLVFYTDGGGDMYHVAIYSGGGNMIEAPYEGKDVREVPVRSYQLLGQVARFTG